MLEKCHFEKSQRIVRFSSSILFQNFRHTLQKYEKNNEEENSYEKGK